MPRAAFDSQALPVDTTNARDFFVPSDESRVLDIVESLLARMRNGESVDLPFECRDCPDLMPQVRSFVDAAVKLALQRGMNAKAC